MVPNEALGHLAQLYRQKMPLTYSFLEWVRILPGMDDPALGHEGDAEPSSISVPLSTDVPAPPEPEPDPEQDATLPAEETTEETLTED